MHSQTLFSHANSLFISKIPSKSNKFLQDFINYWKTSYIRKILDIQSTIGKAYPFPHGQLGINSQLLPDWLGTYAVC